MDSVDPGRLALTGRAGFLVEILKALRSRTVQVLHPRCHVARPPRGESLASSVSRQAPLPAPAAALACSHLRRASSPGVRSARLYQRRQAVARAAAATAGPAIPSALPTPISTAATASNSRGRSCRDGSVRRDGVTMSCPRDSLSFDTAPDTPHAHAFVASMGGHPPEGRPARLVVAGPPGERGQAPLGQMAHVPMTRWVRRSRQSRPGRGHRVRRVRVGLDLSDAATRPRCGSNPCGEIASPSAGVRCSPGEPGWVGRPRPRSWCMRSTPRDLG